jgi:ribosomal protein S7
MLARVRRCGLSPYSQTLEIVKAAQLSKLQSSGDSGVVTDPLQVFHEAIDNSKPVMGIMGVKRAGKLYHVSSYYSTSNTSTTYMYLYYTVGWAFNC